LALVKNHTHEWNTFTSFIDWKVFFYYLFNYFFIICIYSEIEFIKPSDDVKIQRKTITFTKDRYVIVQYSLTEWLTQGLWGCLFFLYNFYIYIFYFVSQVLCICTNYRGVFSMRIFFFLFVMILFFFYLIIRWGIGIASESKLEVLKDDIFYHHNCFYYFLLFCLIILFYYYSIEGNNSHSWIYVGKDSNPSIFIGIVTHTRVCLEVNTHGDSGLFHQWQAY
jgi:hypothetical protein